jgi:GDP-L-fucose synthase
MDKNSRIFVAGGETLIGCALLRQLQRHGYQQVTDDQNPPLNLTDANHVADFFARHSPEYVFLAAGKSGGIEANRHYPAELMLDNLLVECHLIHNAYQHGVKKLLYLASSCTYPKLCPQPMRIESLLTGPLEPTNEAYAVAKIAGIKLCEAYRQQYGANFIVGIPANAFGPEDDFSLDNSHVIPALLRKMHEAKARSADQVEIWGTGAPRREFIFADDLAEACIFVMQHYNGAEPINLGGGEDVSIRELADLALKVVGYQGQLYFDTSKPDGMPLKALDASRLLEMGWAPTTSLQAGLEATYMSFRNILITNKNE